jgi:hypothetical protein
VLLQAGDREHPRARAERDDQLVVVQLALLALERLHAHAPPLGIGAQHLGHAHVGGRQLLAQRHHQLTGLERRSRGSGQQRRVEHEVDVVDERHPRGLRRQDALEAAGGGEPAEPATQDQELPGHGAVSVRRRRARRRRR